MRRFIGQIILYTGVYHAVGHFMGYPSLSDPLALLFFILLYIGISILGLYLLDSGFRGRKHVYSVEMFQVMIEPQRAKKLKKTKRSPR